MIFMNWSIVMSQHRMRDMNSDAKLLLMTSRKTESLYVKQLTTYPGQMVWKIFNVLFVLGTIVLGLKVYVAPDNFVYGKI